MFNNTLEIMIKSIIFVILFTACYARSPLPDSTDTKFQNECLNKTNAYRMKHHSPALVYNQTVVDYAKARCKNISQSEGLGAGHMGLKGYGENLFWNGSTTKNLTDCSIAITTWYNEMMKYDFNKPGMLNTTAEFTQLVWKNTTRVGCARCSGMGSKFNENYIICNYNPPGNVQGQFPANVLKP